MSEKTLYEIYKNICDCKDVEKEDLRLAVLTYRSLLWFSNHDVEEMYKNSNQNIFNKIRYETNVERYRKALDTVPRKWLGNDNIPGTQLYKEKEEICNNILDGFNKWKEEQNNLYKANYMQDPFNILTNENLIKLEEHCKKAIHYEKGKIKEEHEVTLCLLYKYQEQKEQNKELIEKLKKDIKNLKMVEDKTQMSLMKCTKKDIDSGEWKKLSELALEIKQDIKTKQEILYFIQGGTKE